jgi:hypothetical protein
MNENGTLKAKIAGYVAAKAGAREADIRQAKMAPKTSN